MHPDAVLESLLRRHIPALRGCRRTYVVAVHGRFYRFPTYAAANAFMARRFPDNPSWRVCGEVRTTDGLLLLDRNHNVCGRIVER